MLHARDTCANVPAAACTCDSRVGGGDDAVHERALHEFEIFGRRGCTNNS